MKNLQIKAKEIIQNTAAAHVHNQETWIWSLPSQEVQENWPPWLSLSNQNIESSKNLQITNYKWLVVKQKWLVVLPDFHPDFVAQVFYLLEDVSHNYLEPAWLDSHQITV